MSREAVDAVLRERGPLGDDAPRGAVLVGWLVVCEWALLGGGVPERRWYDQQGTEGQGAATSVGLLRVADDLIMGD